VAIRPPKYNSQGFTLIEMLITLGVAGIILGIAAPSFLSFNKPLRDGSLQFKSHLNLIRSKAIASGQAYRLRPKYNTLAEYRNGIAHNFVVEYAANCRTPENNIAPVTTRWQMVSQLDLDLPLTIGIPATSTTIPDVPTPITIDNPLDWSGVGTANGRGICFDSRGIVDSLATRIILRDFRGDNRAKLSVINLTLIGGIDVATYTENTPGNFVVISLNNQGNPEF
jgi:prepilin-type N-terminal cleavage/methylation domain-containing protein